MTEDTTPAAVPDEAAGLVRTVGPLRIALRLQTAEGKIAALRDLCDSIAASVPEGEPATVAVSRVLGILGSKKEGPGHAAE